MLICKVCELLIGFLFCYPDAGNYINILPKEIVIRTLLIYGRVNINFIICGSYQIDHGVATGACWARQFYRHEIYLCLSTNHLSEMVMLVSLPYYTS